MKTGRACRCAHGDESGFSLIETILALSLFALAIVGIATSAGAGLRLTGTSNGRQGATQVATQFIEAMRAVDWASLGMPTGTVYENGTPGNPDQAVNTAPTPDTFAVPKTSLVENMVEGGGVPSGHKPAPVALGGRRFQAYQYLSTPSGTTDQKRATVVVVWSGSGTSGTTEQLAFSTIIFPGKIAFGPTTTTSTTTPPPTTTSTSTSTTSTTLAGCAPGYSTPPTVVRFEIASGTGISGVEYVNSGSVQLKAYATAGIANCGPVRVQFRNESGSYSALTTVTANPTVVGWSLSAGDGLKTVTAQFLDLNNNLATATDTVTLDTVSPSKPSSLTGTITKSGSSISATLTWANDARDGAPTSYVSSYQLRRAVGSGVPSVIATIPVTDTSPGCVKTNGTCTYTDIGLSNTTYVYSVIAVDNAGNASVASNTRFCNPGAGNGTVTCT